MVPRDDEAVAASFGCALAHRFVVLQTRGFAVLEDVRPHAFCAPAGWEHSFNFQHRRLVGFHSDLGLVKAAAELFTAIGRSSENDEAEQFGLLGAPLYLPAGDVRAKALLVGSLQRGSQASNDRG